MAFSYDALYRVRATAAGTPELRAMEQQLRGIGPSARESARGVSVLGRALGDVGKIAAGIGLADLTGRMLGAGRASVVAGDEALRSATAIKTLGDEFGETSKLIQAAANYAEKYKVSQNDANAIIAQAYAKLRPLNVEFNNFTGILEGVTQAGRRMGLQTRDINEVIRQLSQGMGSARLNGDELRSIMERMPIAGQAVANAFNNIAKSKGLQQITKEQGEAMLKQLKENQKEELRVIEDGMSKRERLAEKEFDNRLKQINSKYEKELGLLNESLQEQQRQRDKAAKKELDRQMQTLQRRFENEKRMLSRQREDADRASEFKPIEGSPGMYQRFLGQQRLPGGFLQDVYETVNEEQKRAYERQLEDQRIVEDQALEDRQRAESEALQERGDNEKRARDKAMNEEIRTREEAVKKRQQAEEEIVRDSLERQKKEFQRQLEDQIAANKIANQKMIDDIKQRIIVTRGDLKRLGEEGRITPDVAKQAFGPELQRLTKNFPEATPLDRLSASMGNLSSTIGKNLLDGIRPIVPGVETLVGAFGRLDSTIQKLIIGIGAVGVVGAGAAAARAGGGALLGRLAGGLRGPGGGAPAAGPGLPPVAPGIPPGRLPTGIPGAPAGPGGPMTPPWARSPGRALNVPPPPPPVATGGFGGSVVRGLGRAASLGGGLLGVSEQLNRIFDPELAAQEAYVRKLAEKERETAYNKTIEQLSKLKEVSNQFPAIFEESQKKITSFMSSVGNSVEKTSARIEPALKTATDGVTKQMATASDALQKQVGFETKAWDEFFMGLYGEFGKGIEAKIEEIKSKGLGNVLKNAFEFESKAWDEFFLGLYKDFGKNIENMTSKLVDGLKSGLSNAMKGLRDIANGMISIVENAVNAAANIINARIADANSVLQQLRIPWRVGFQAPTVRIPRLARGGYFNRSTIAEIGEAGDEYAIPDRMMPAAIQAYQQGRRGAALVAAMQSGGLSPGSSLTASSMAGGGGPTTINLPTINLQVAQAVALPSGDLAFSESDVQAMLAQSQADTARALWQMLQSSSAQAHNRP